MEQNTPGAQPPEHRRVRLSNPRGLHVRPCSAIASTASAFQAQLWITCRGERVDGKRVLELLTLTAGCGEELELESQGSDARALLDALESLFRAGFQERD